MRNRLILPGFRLPSYNSLQQNALFMKSGRGRGMLMGKIKQIKADVAVLLQSAENQNAWTQERTLSYPLHIYFTYYKSGRAYDHDNALMSANKFIIDTMVQLGMLQDDDPAHVTPHLPEYVKCKRGEEKVIVDVD
jgi:hypothetical protein